MSAAYKRGPFVASLLAVGLLLPASAYCQDFPDPGRDMNESFETVANFPMPDGIRVSGDDSDDEEGKGRGASKINVKRTRGDEP